jgi:uncharacterized protein with HEPN domain
VPHRNWEIRIHDILKALDAIHCYTQGMNFKKFVADRKTVDAVVRNLIIIGEASANLPDEICQRYPEIPWYEMRGIRNLVVHEYFGVSDKIIWNTVQVDLPPLPGALKTILDL